MASAAHFSPKTPILQQGLTDPGTCSWKESSKTPPLPRRYRKAFEDFARALQREFPGLKFSGNVQDPGALRIGAAQVLQMVFFGGLGVSLLGKSMLPPRAAQFLNENQLATFGALFGCNMLAGQLINTGAFEIFYNGTPIWSKMETGRFPQLPELVGLLREAAAAQS